MDNLAVELGQDFKASPSRVTTGPTKRSKMSITETKKILPPSLGLLLDSICCSLAGLSYPCKGFMPVREPSPTLNSGFYQLWVGSSTCIAVFPGPLRVLKVSQSVLHLVRVSPCLESSLFCLLMTLQEPSQSCPSSSSPNQTLSALNPGSFYSVIT